MSDTHGQLTATAAEVYDRFFVPALFAEWAPRVADELHGAPALDVACGTGVLARELARRVGPTNVSALDCNADMLSVARRHEPAIDWRLGEAEALPFEAETFAAVASQFGLMFFRDRVRALREMWRVLVPGAKLVVAVWARLDDTPGYAAMASLLDRLFGPAVARELEAPFCLGDVAVLRDLASQAGLSNIAVETRVGRARFESIRDWVHTDIRGWTLADKIDDEQYGRLLAAAEGALAGFTTSGGQVEFHSPALILTARRP